MTPYTRPAAPQTSTTCYAASAFRAVLGSNQGSAMLAPDLLCDGDRYVLARREAHPIPHPPATDVLAHMILMTDLAQTTHLTLLNSPSGPILSSDTPLQTGQEYELISIQILKQTSAELIPLHAI